MMKAGADKIALVAYASSRDRTPFQLGGDEGEFEIWGCNKLYEQPDMTGPNRAYDRWFEIHNMNYLSANSPDHVNWIKKCPIAVYMYEDYKDQIPSCLKFPIEDSIEAFGDYFTSTIAYMMAMALMEALDFAPEEVRREYGIPFIHKPNGAKQIHLYGIHMAGDEEYFHQKGCVEYYLGIARGTGIPIILPEESALLKAPRRYGMHHGFTIARAAAADIEAHQKLMQREQSLAEEHQKQAFIQMGVGRGIEMMRKKWLWDEEIKAAREPETPVSVGASEIDEQLCEALAAAINQDIDADAVGKALTQLGADHIGILAAYLWQKMSYKQMGEKLETSSGDAYMKVNEAWEKLHKALNITTTELPHEETGEEADTGLDETLGQPDNGSPS